MRKANFIVSGVFTAFALLIIALSLTFPPSNHGVPGPGIFPFIIAALIIISAVALLITTLIAGPKLDSKIDLRSKNIINVYITMAGLVVYTVLLPMVGFITTTTVMLYLYIRWFSKRSWWKCAVISLLFTLAIYFLFGLVLNVPMRFGLVL
ncbi:tripartite tricarboxylate transporter TctB family protein [Sphaerochaeta sp. PS]|uniref:tripartite tricarboxylate transporter TctB family protein n=1 Tax=Sphaerochaeta sp. PS TaxID=3076336 RepID=UPI0028A41B5F|nr:tripartite tricarboxylate transporter TctB family protein [Sphaerochaeta sp. PS]MDT4762781.1 tripartite tricarboxylate transporter TctB family protein [Sphaerochaeta sp. PS]